MWLLMFLAVWPLLGMAALWQMNRVLQNMGHPQLAAAEGGGEVLARMYLWPLVLWRVLRSARKGGRPPAR